MGQKYTMIGYHGTTSDSAVSILNTGVFHDSTKNSEWLGKGVYFFAYKADATAWACREIQKPEKMGQKAAVLSARLEYDGEQILDLDDPAALEKMHEVLRRIGRVVEKHVSADCSKLAGRELWKQWCLNCELYRKVNPKIGIIIYTFRFSNDFAEDCFCRNQRQICVSNHDIIKSVSREGLS